MKSKIIFLFLFFVNQLFAINSNGFVANINGFNFAENKNHEINEVYIYYSIYYMVFILILITFYCFINLLNSLFEEINSTIFRFDH